MTCCTSPRPHPRSRITSSTSAAASFSACMSRLRAPRRWMAQLQTLEALYDAAASRAATMPVPPCSPTSRLGASQHSFSSCIGEASCGTTRWLSADCLRQARRGRWRSELPGSAGHPDGFYAGELLFLLVGCRRKSGQNGGRRSLAGVLLLNGRVWPDLVSRIPRGFLYLYYLLLLFFYFYLYI